MKKIKLDYSTFHNILEAVNNGYFDSYRATITKSNGEKVRGTAFKLEKPLTDETKAAILSWKNTRLFISQCQYAPELKKNLVFIADKCL